MGNLTDLVSNNKSIISSMQAKSYVIEEANQILTEMESECNRVRTVYNNLAVLINKECGEEVAGTSKAMIVKDLAKSLNVSYNGMKDKKANFKKYVDAAVFYENYKISLNNIKSKILNIINIADEANAGCAQNYKDGNRKELGNDLCNIESKAEDVNGDLDKAVNACDEAIAAILKLATQEKIEFDQYKASADKYITEINTGISI